MKLRSYILIFFAALTACASKPEESTYVKKATSSSTTIQPFGSNPNPNPLPIGAPNPTPIGAVAHTQAEEDFIKSVWNLYFAGSVDATPETIVVLAQELRLNGCVKMVASLVLSNYKRQPFNLLPYIAGVQGIGVGNSSFNYGFMTMSYKTIFGFGQSTESINYWLPLMDNGTLDALGITNSFLADKGSMQQRCDIAGFK